MFWYLAKADKGRWYILAYKENGEHSDVEAQVFALDRTQHLEVLKEKFQPNRKIDAATYFHDCFGIWRDYKHFPVQDITIECTQSVAHYLRTLPLHHSQVEITPADGISEKCLFQYHISPSPDFISELSKWEKNCVIVETKDKSDIRNK